MATGESRFDLEWDDEEVIPEKVYPDTVFTFNRMAEVVLDMVAVDGVERVLDIGCGRAIDALQLAKRGGKAVGLDPSGKMLREAKSYIGDSEVALVRGIGEALPFKRHCLDKILCKGALDHFADPQRTLKEMSQVLRPGGEAIIATANFESLSCRLGKAWYLIARRTDRDSDERHPWQPPLDHTCRFDCSLLIGLVEHHFEVKKTTGVSLLWTAPYWGKILSMLPRWVSTAILTSLDGIARIVPSLSDVIVIKGTPRND